MRLKDKVGIVTGAGRGIGEAIARRLSEEGAKVVISDIDMPAAEEVTRELRDSGRDALAVRANVADKAEVEAMVKRVVEEFGRIDILVNNAGMSVVGASEELDEQRWRQGIDVMLTGVFFCSQIAGREMIRERSGKIISISSGAGLTGSPRFIVYGASKAAIITFTKGLAKEVIKSGINVNCIAPGIGDTNFLRTGKFPPGELEKALTTVPQGKATTPEDIGNAVAFLASDASRRMAGQCIRV